MKGQFRLFEGHGPFLGKEEKRFLRVAEGLPRWLGHPQRKLPFPKGTRSAMVNRLFCFLEEEGQPLISLELSLWQLAKKSSRGDILPVPARLFGFTLEPKAGGMG